MAITEFQLVDNQTFLPADVTLADDIGENIFVSPEQSNGTGVDLSTGIQVVMDYHDLQSAGGPMLQAVLEGKSSGGRFYPIARQFEDFQLLGVQQTRRIIMSPDLGAVEPSPNKDDKMSVGGIVIDQTSRQYGVLPLIWRVRVCIVTPTALTSVRMSIYGHRFNQLTLPGDFGSLLVDTEGSGSVLTLGSA